MTRENQDKAIGRLEGQMLGVKEQVGAVFRKQDSHAKETRDSIEDLAKEFRDALKPIQETGGKVLALCQDVEKRLNNVEPKVENHETHKNRAVGYLIGSAGGGTLLGYILSLFTKPSGG